MKHPIKTFLFSTFLFFFSLNLCVQESAFAAASPVSAASDNDVLLFPSTATRVVTTPLAAHAATFAAGCTCGNCFVNIGPGGEDKRIASGQKSSYPTFFVAHQEDIPVAISWSMLVRECRHELELCIDQTEDLLSLTRQATDYLRANKKLGLYAPLLGLEADDFPYKIRPDILEHHIRSLEEDSKTHTENLEGAHYLLDSFHESRITFSLDSGVLTQGDFVKNAIVLNAAILRNFQPRHQLNLSALEKLSRLDSSNDAPIPIICIGDYKKMLPAESISMWVYEELHLTTRWALVKRIWNFLGECDPTLIEPKNAERLPLLAEMFGNINAYGNLPYLQGSQTEPHLEAVTIDTPLYRLTMERCVFGPLKKQHENSKKYRDELHKKFAKSAAKKNALPSSKGPSAIPLRSLDDIMAEIGDGAEKDGKGIAAVPQKEKKTRPKGETVKITKDPLKVQKKKKKKDTKAANRKAALTATLTEEATVAAEPSSEVILTPDRQRRREAREQRRLENETKMKAGAKARVAAPKKPVRKSSAEHAADHKRTIAAIASYKARIGTDLDIGLPPLDRTRADFFHLFYTESSPVCWWAFQDNFEAMGGVILDIGGSKHKFSWSDPRVPNVTLSKEIHEPHPHYILGNHYRLHIGRFLNTIRAFRHERMRAHLGITVGKVFDRRTFADDLIRFWH